jgi:hypothetical protein
MAAMRAPEVVLAKSFTADVEALRAEFPEIDGVVNDLRELLLLGYSLPHLLIDPDQGELPGVYVTKLDYPPHGPDGLGVFLVTYHQSLPAPSMTTPLYRYTLLTMTELAI